MKVCSYCFSKINYENEDYSQQPFPTWTAIKKGHHNERKQKKMSKV